MKKRTYAVAAFAILFLFLIQTAGTLVESIYILDLMNTSLDEKVLGLLFFFTPAILLVFPRKYMGAIGWIAVGALCLARGLVPFLDTAGRMLAAGVSLGAALSLLPILMGARLQGLSSALPASWVSAGFALAVALSVALRTANYGLEYSLFPEGGWSGWLMAALLVWSLLKLDWRAGEPSRKRIGAVTLPMLGIFLAVGLAWFAFSAPAVIARWTEGDYRLIVITVSSFCLLWAGLELAKPDWVGKISRSWLIAWNLAFTLALTLTLLAHRVPFPVSPDSPPVVVGPPSWQAQLLLGLTLLLFPVIFLDLRTCAGRIRAAEPSPRDLVPGTLLGSLVLVLAAFSQIFSNVWGYVEPISPWFRNKFWFPYLLLAGLSAVLAVVLGTREQDSPAGPRGGSSPGWAALLALLYLGTTAGALLTTQVKDFEAPEDSLVVMTYNIQQANDASGERSYRQQLAVIQQVDPDILALQESDSTRISLNNSDYVRYYAGKLGYYSYYGPTTVTGTYGTAILSKYPLEDARTVFSYSDQDEIGSAEARVSIAGETFTIFNVHPDGSDTAMLAWAENLLDRAQGKPRVISLGDYNLRDDEDPYQRIDGVLSNAWTSVYPSEISPDGTDMSGKNRIDHIFLSPDLQAQNPVYLLPPESATDHPVHWSEIIWEQ